jgi:hypothetical protein
MNLTVPVKTPEEVFGGAHYQRHNARRLEHLASLRLPIAGRDVLELGAGIGDHTAFFLDRGCRVTAIEARPENVSVFQARRDAMLPERRERLTIIQGDLDAPETVEAPPHAVVHSYGLLYHLENPDAALDWSMTHTSGLLLLETCVSFGSNETVQSVREDGRQPSQSYRGGGSRPTRAWIFNRLKRRFPFVYVPRTQPAHEEFPLDWTSPKDWLPHARAVFIASHTALDDPLLLTALPARQVRA